MDRLSLLKSVRVEDLCSFRHWPFQEVVGIESISLTSRSRVYVEHDERFMPPEQRKVYVADGGAPRLIPQRIKPKGFSTVHVPHSFRIHVIDPHGPIFLFRHWDWMWILNWMMRTEEWTRFAPEPCIRHSVVQELVEGAKRSGIYVGLEREREFPVTWSQHTPVFQVPFLGEKDQRFKGDFIWEPFCTF